MTKSRINMPLTTVDIEKTLIKVYLKQPMTKISFFTPAGRRKAGNVIRTIWRSHAQTIKTRSRSASV